MFSRIRIGFIFLLLAVVVGSVFATACGGGEETSTPTPGMTMVPAATATEAPGATATAAATPQIAPQTASVAIKDFEFTPETVTISLGGTVTWTNDGPSLHTVTADDGSFDSGDLSATQTFSHTFQTAGTFTYICSIHPFMTATVIVQSGNTAISPGY
jgi:plastocyanin